MIMMITMVVAISGSDMIWHKILIVIILADAAEIRLTKLVFYDYPSMDIGFDSSQAVQSHISGTLASSHRGQGRNQGTAQCLRDIQMEDHIFEGVVDVDNQLYGCFQKWWYPTTMGFPTKNDHFGVFWGYPIFGNTHIWMERNGAPCKFGNLGFCWDLEITGNVVIYCENGPEILEKTGGGW